MHSLHTAFFRGSYCSERETQEVKIRDPIVGGVASGRLECCAELVLVSSTKSANRYGYAHTHTQTKPLGMSASSAENLQSDIFAEQYIPFSLLDFFVSIGAL